MSRKPFDDAFKDLAEQDPEALLQLIGALPAGATVTSLPREVAVQALLPDQPFEINVAGARHIVHFEAQTYYAHDLPYRIADYDVRLWIKYSLHQIQPASLFLRCGLCVGGNAAQSAQWADHQCWRPESDGAVSVGRVVADFRRTRTVA